MNKIRLYYDFQTLILQRYGGISRYFYEIISRLPNEYVDINIPIIDNTNYYFESYFNKKAKHTYQRRGIWKLNKLNTRLHLSIGGKKVFHPTYYDPYFLKWYDGMLVVTIHDMAQEKFPEFFKDDIVVINKKKNIERADRIIVPSNATKIDILETYPNVDENKIKVIYHGSNDNNDIELDEANIKKSLFEKHEKIECFFLFVGQRKGYKNFDKLLDAMLMLMDKIDSIGLFCAGGGEFTEEEKSKLQKHSDRIVQKNVSDDELIYLYRNAIAFVYPSLIEGFGIPILEAFQNGCPVLLSEIECFKEIARGAAIYFDPKNSESILEKLYYIMNLDKENRSTLADNEKKRMALFDWDISAKEHFKVYKELWENI